MKQTFVTAVSLQAPQNLKEVVYQPVDFCYKLNKPTRFPIIPVIMNNLWENAKDSYVIVIRPTNADTDQNFEVLKRELTDVGILEENIIDLPMEGATGKRESLELLLRLTDAIPEDTLIYSDITYNTKPMSAMVLYAMQLIEKFKDAEVCGIYYGEIPRTNSIQTGNATLYDITAFNYLSDVINNMDIMGIKDLRSAVIRLMGM